ncbi:MAG TPA: hypothetical protein VL651_11660 [Bacteroidia bacterium]|jgi:hypothetical protein|nr:hypothetical protein [Bacteroidia bacterium]
MKTAALKKELHRSIDAMPDEAFLEAVYAMFRSYASGYESGYDLSQKEKAELDKERKQFKAGKGKNYSVTEVRKKLLSRLKK